MLKSLRKYNKWILVIGGSLLMLAFLVQPAIQQLGGDPGAQLWATLDGVKLRRRDAQLAAGEMDALRRLTGGVYPDAIGLDPSDPMAHWLLLVHEARLGGFVGEWQDGAEWLPAVRADADMQRASMQIFNTTDWRSRLGEAGIGGFLAQQYERNLEEHRAANDMDAAQAGGPSRLTAQQVHMAGAKLRGVMRMVEAYFNAARVSDVRGAAAGRRERDAAYVDYVFIPASAALGAVAEPDEPALAAFFEEHKGTRPRDGQHGIGYLLPERVRLEWLTLDAQAIRDAITLDPVAVHKRYLREKASKYPGEFASERARVEQDMKEGRLSEVLQAAHTVIQAEVRKATRALAAEGRYKKLPADWDSLRPRLDAIAQTVVVEVERATQTRIPLPTVTTRAADWVERGQASSLDGIGASSLQTGSLSIPFEDVLFSVRELRPSAEPGLLAVQVGITPVENYLSSGDGSRHYFTVLEARPESSPDSLEEIRELVTRDYKRVRAYEHLASRTEEFKSLAASQGLKAVLDAAVPAGFTPGEGEAVPDVRTRVRVMRSNASGTAPDINRVNVPWFRDAVMFAAETLDPLRPAAEYDPVASTVAAALPSSLGVAVARITALEPLTRERYRVLDAVIENVQQQRELVPENGETDRPFALERLKQRHRFVADDAESEEQPADGSGAPAGG